MKAHIGGNQVIGFNSSSTSVGLGRDFGGAGGAGAGRVEGTEFSMARGYA
jgi:hypothetical protein